LVFCIGQIPASLPAPVVQVVVVAVGCLLLYVAVKIGYVILKVVLGLAALALLGGAIWWFWSGMNH
jgi:uncharacterized membrane protein YGL010W